METRNIDFTSLFQEGVSQELKASPMSDLEHLLRQEHSDGQLHSTGRVTLDPSMAVEKFALHTLPRPTAWLVHILRALVEMKTQSLKVFHYEKQLWLWFQATEVWTYENFLENLNAAHPILKSFHLLRSGLLMAALPNNSCFHYTLAGSAEEVFFDGQHLWRRPATTPSTAVKKSGLTTAIEGFHLIRIDTQLSAYDLTVEIRRTGCLAPFAISIHCHPHTNSCNNALQVMAGRGFQIVYGLMVGRAGAQKLPTSLDKVQSVIEDKKSDSEESWTTINCLPTDSLISALTARAHEISTLAWVHNQSALDPFDLGNYRPLAGYAYFVRQGIVVDRLQLKVSPAVEGDALRLSFSMLLNAEHLSLDASGLGIVRDQACFDSLVSALEDALATSPAIDMDEKSDLGNYKRDRRVLNLLLGVVSTGALALGAATSPWLILGGGLGLGTSIFNYWQALKNFRQLADKLRQPLQEFVLCLPRFLNQLKSAGDFSQAEHLLGSSSSSTDSDTD